ncbi:hypothetical protein BAJUN_01340 [Bajunvirus bajun]|uniref:Uncharacterized protein n=1 Tax=Brevundimonas phage vB_BgoS-Bajun TaxID=2948594 RepID=A0A9E7SRZ6_9CAUD|nr:hypothetical protein BAJUN_01340 [Brevundimonas phage vB_BgoS-Bajun]
MGWLVFYLIVILTVGWIIVRAFMRGFARDRWMTAGRMATTEMKRSLRMEGQPQYRIFREDDDDKYAVQGRAVQGPWESSWTGPKTPPFKPHAVWRTLHLIDNESGARSMIAKLTKPKNPMKICFDGKGDTVECGADDGE